MERAVVSAWRAKFPPAVVYKGQKTPVSGLLPTCQDRPLHSDVKCCVCVCVCSCKDSCKQKLWLRKQYMPSIYAMLLYIFYLFFLQYFLLINFIFFLCCNGSDPVLVLQVQSKAHWPVFLVLPQADGGYGQWPLMVLGLSWGSVERAARNLGLSRSTVQFDHNGVIERVVQQIAITSTRAGIWLRIGASRKQVTGGSGYVLAKMDQVVVGQLTAGLIQLIVQPSGIILIYSVVFCSTKLLCYCIRQLFWGRNTAHSDGCYQEMDRKHSVAQISWQPKSSATVQLGTQAIDAFGRVGVMSLEHSLLGRGK